MASPVAPISTPLHVRAHQVLGATYPWIARRLLTDQSPELRVGALFKSCALFETPESAGLSFRMRDDLAVPLGVPVGNATANPSCRQ